MLWLRLTRDASHACIIIAKSGANIAQTIADYKTWNHIYGGSTEVGWIFMKFSPKSPNINITMLNFWNCGLSTDVPILHQDDLVIPTICLLSSFGQYCTNINTYIAGLWSICESQIVTPDQFGSVNSGGGGRRRGMKKEIGQWRRRRWRRRRWRRRRRVGCGGETVARRKLQI